MEMENKIEENLIFQDTADRFAKMQIGSQFPLRPGYGTRVQSKIVLWANYIPLLPNMDLVLYRYDMTVDPIKVNNAAGKKIRIWQVRNLGVS